MAAPTCQSVRYYHGNVNKLWIFLKSLPNFYILTKITVEENSFYTIFAVKHLQQEDILRMFILILIYIFMYKARRRKTMLEINFIVIDLINSILL